MFQSACTVTSTCIFFVFVDNRKKEEKGNLESNLFVLTMIDKYQNNCCIVTNAILLEKFV